jgi:putative membrane protein
MQMIWHFLLYAVAIFVTARIVPGVKMKSFVTAILVAVLIGIAGITVTPILKFITFPINFVTLGLFTFVIDAIIIMVIDKFLDDFEIDGFGMTFIYTLVLALINMVLTKIF